MTDQTDLLQGIECAIGLHPAIRDGQTASLADAVMAVVQPKLDDLPVKADRAWRIHRAVVAQLAKDQATIRRVHALADQLIADGDHRSANGPGVGEDMLAALDAPAGSAEEPLVPIAYRWAKSVDADHSVARVPLTAPAGGPETAEVRLDAAGCLDLAAMLTDAARHLAALDGPA